MDANLAERVARLEAVEQITALKHRYLRASDAKDPVGFRNSFVKEGAVLDYGPRMGRHDGADALVDIYEKMALRRIDGRYVIFDMHHAVHPDIEVHSATEARGRWTLRFRQVDVLADRESVSAIEYDDDYRVEDGQWRIVRSEVTVLWTISTPLPEGYQIHGSLA